MANVTDVRTGKPISVEVAVEIYGVGDRRSDLIKPSFRCDLCGDVVYICAHDSANVTFHFKHYRGSNCISLPIRHAPFANLRPRDASPEAAKLLKRQFAENWQYVFRKMKTLIPFLSYIDLIKIIELSSKINIWQYRNLCLTEIPYTFVLMKDFDPTSAYSPGSRNAWYRFWRRTPQPGELWIWAQQQQQLCRGEFGIPRSGQLPGIQHLIKWEQIQIVDDFLNISNPAIDDKIIHIVNDKLSFLEF